jgi:hypothetical protein
MAGKFYISFIEHTGNHLHALPCACRRLAFLCPTWQQSASSTITSLTVRNLFLLENSVLTFDGICVGRRSKHDIFQSQYQLRGILSLHNEIRKSPTQCSEYCRTLPCIFDYIQQVIQHISHSSTSFQKKKSLEEILFVTLRSVRHATHITHLVIYVIEPVWLTGSLIHA